MTLTKILAEIPDRTYKVYLACSVTEADDLAAPLLKGLEEHLPQVGFACYWNEVICLFEKVSVILRVYKEPMTDVDCLIYLGNSETCLTRTNLRDLVKHLSPKTILLVSPVLPLEEEQDLKDLAPNLKFITL
jgi:hypothetical protein